MLIQTLPNCLVPLASQKYGIPALVNIELQGNGYIAVSDLRDILRALDDNITEVRKSVLNFLLEAD